MLKTCTEQQHSTSVSAVRKALSVINIIMKSGLIKKSHKRKKIIIMKLILGTLWSETLVHASCNIICKGIELE